MATAVYILNSVTFRACAVLLLRGFIRGKQRLLLWSGLCFAGWLCRTRWCLWTW